MNVLFFMMALFSFPLRVVASDCEEAIKGFDYITQDAGLIRQLKQLSKYAQSPFPVLIHGETGTGKEIVARRLHMESYRRKEPFIAVNCGQIPENLFDGEFFGYERGAFTGAVNKFQGLVGMANKGTLFLDEIGELPLHMQAKLLRFLDSGEYRRIGSTQFQRSTVRIVAASHVDLKEAVKRGEFREDLYQRLNVLPINLSPLRDRLKDIPLIARHVLGQFGDEFRLTTQAIEWLQTRYWSGNVRELENMMARMTVVSDSPTLDAPLFAEFYPDKTGLDKLDDSVPMNGVLTLDEFKVVYIRRVLQQNSGNKMKTARILGINVKTLYNILKKAE